MLSLDLSTTNIILTVAVVGLFTFFIVLLIRLNPSSEKKEDSETEIVHERPEQSRTPIIVAEDPKGPQPQPQPTRVEVPRFIEKPVVAVGPAMGGGSIQTRSEIPAPPSPWKENREVPKPPEKTPMPTKSAVVSGKRDCLHHFGYLRTFPKNSPIPDECFGCERIVDCLVDKKSNVKNDRRR